MWQDGLYAWLGDEEATDKEPEAQGEGPDGEKDLPPRAIMTMILELARPDLKLIILAVVSSLASSVCGLLSPILLGSALDLVIQNGSSAALSELLVLFAGIFTLEITAGLCEYVKAGTHNDIGDFVRQRARIQLFSSVLHQDQTFLDQTHTSSLNHRFTMLDELHGLAGHLIPNLTGSVFTLAATGVYLLQRNLLLGVIVLSIFSLQGLLESVLDRQRGRLFRKLIEFERVCNEFREEAWSCVKTIKSFRGEKRHSNAFSALNDDDRVIRCKLVRSHALKESIGFLMSTLSSNLIWLIGLSSLILSQGQLQGEGRSSSLMWGVGFASMGELSAFLVLVTRVRGAANTFIQAISGVRKGASKLSQSLQLIHRQPKMQPGSTTLHITSTKDKEVNSPPSLSIDLQGIRFTYASRPDTEVLRGLDLSLEACQVTALCGPSGGGKSTIASLLLRLYDPTEGKVLFNGIDLKDLSESSMTSLIAIVSQEPVLFSDSIENNIRFGNKKAAREEMINAAIAANCHDFISNFTQGYETPVGEKGVRLSGGQKQRIAIARALLCNPALLILDEASSALDAESEHLVQEALERVMRGRTVLVVAHRLSTIRMADKIVVVSEGRAVEEGRHEELVANEEGIYHQFIQRQLRG